MRIVTTLALAAALATGTATYALAQDHSGMAGMDHGAMAGHAMASPGTTGKVNAVDPVKYVINLTHGPIAALGWPGMTMDFGVLPSVDLSKVKTGDTVAFTVSKDARGAFVIDSVKTAK